MSDLISRSDVTKVIDELEVYTVGRLNTQKVEISVLQLQRFINTLKDIPTAYDVEKVVEEIKEATFGVDVTYTDSEDVVESEEAIRIIRKGGVE